MEKSIRFKQGVDKWIKNKFKGIFDYATGVGKTSVGILCSEYYLRNENDRAAITIITPNDIICNQWRKAIEKALPKKFNNNFNIFSINYIISNQFNIVTDILILDEMHEYTSEKALEVIKHKIKFDKYVGLTASTDDKKFYNFKEFEIIDIIKESEAIALGFIADFIEYNLSVELTEHEQYMYNKFTEQIEKHQVYFSINNFNFLDLANLCIRGGKDRKGVYYDASIWCKSVARKHGYDKTKNNNEITPINIKNIAFALTKAIRSRLQLLKESYNKQVAVMDLLGKFPDKKAIVFSESTDVCDKLYRTSTSAGIKTSIYHSKLKPIMMPGKTGKLIKYGLTRLKKKAIDEIATTSRVLVTGSSLDKGFNQEDIKLSITVSGTRNSTKYTQRSGRAKRVHGEEKALLVNLFVKDTVDETSLNSRQSNVTHTIIEVNNVNQISDKGSSNNNINFTLNDFPTL